jgi:dephospho-CoA kinase
MSPKARRLIGLTGGIGTGKSTVAKYLVDIYKFVLLDADIYAREAVQSGSPIVAKIFNRYGSQVQLPDGSLNRQVLGEIIFNNSQEKAWLESKIHPYVRQQFESVIASFDGDAVLAIPLLFEAKMTDLVTEIWVVCCQVQQQIERLMQRDNLTRQQAIKRINNQMPLTEKVARADVVLDNSSTLEALWKQVDTRVGRLPRRQEKLAF